MAIQQLGLSSLDDADQRPAAGRNNLWHTRRGPSRCVVFVHGLGDDSRDCWYHASSDTYWPDLIRDSPAFHDYSIFLGGYYTSKVHSGSFGIADCAQELFGALSTPIPGGISVLDHSAVIFVCHSLGGIVTRYLLDHHREEFRDKSVGLLLIASPSAGSAWADWAAYLAECLENQTVLTLRTDSDLLGDLDDRFRDLISEGRIPRLKGAEACETRAYKGVLPKIVSGKSAGRYFGKVTKLPRTDHSTCVKPDSPDHPAMQWILRFVHSFEKAFKKDLPERRPPQLVCRRLRWSLALNDDGDAHEEVNLEQITATNAQNFYEVSDDWRDAGHASEPQLVEERSTGAPRFLWPDGKRGIELSPPPASDAPAQLSYRVFSFNSYSMNREELRLKHGRSAGDIDYVQKTVGRERVQELVIQLQFPSTVRLLGDPFLRVLHPDTEQDDMDASRSAARLVDYSPLTRVLTLFVTEPRDDRDYRLCWRLADLPHVGEQSVAESARRSHEEIVERLLELRETAARDVKSAPDMKRLKALHDLMGECGGLIYETVGPISESDLETGLHVLDDIDPAQPAVLRLVHCSPLTEEAWNLELRVGDGNAGRAVKKRAVRIYDSEKARDAPLQHVYRAIGGKPHRWLISVPLFEDSGLVCGVFSAGCYQSKTARALARLEQNNAFPDAIQQLLMSAIRSGNL